MTAILEGAQKELLLQMINAQAEIDGAIALEKFAKGFRLGARMMLEVLTKDDRVFENFQEVNKHGKATSKWGRKHP